MINYINFTLNQKRKFKEIWCFVIYKLACCIFISLEYFSFGELFTDQIVAKKVSKIEIHQHSLFGYYQNHLYLMELACFIIPLITYLVWFKSLLIKIDFKKVLLLCSVYSLCMSIAVECRSFRILILMRFIQCMLLSVAYWLNFVELLVLFKSKHLTPIGLYFTTTALANLLSTSVQFDFFWFYIIMSFLFFGLRLIKLEFSVAINEIKKDEDFELMDIAFKGIRTSLTFFEIACMTAMTLPLNITPFLSAVDLKGYRNQEFKAFPDKFRASFMFISDLKESTNSQKEILHLSFCSLGLFIGFLFATLFSIIKVKKIYLTYLSKLLLMFYLLQLIFGYQLSAVVNNFTMDVVFFFSLALNFSVKLGDIVKGLKRFLILSELVIQLDLLYLRAINLMVIGCLTGLIFGFFTWTILVYSGLKLTQQVKAIAQSFYFGIIILCSLESFENDNFCLMNKSNEPKRDQFNQFDTNMNEKALATIKLSEKANNPTYNNQNLPNQHASERQDYNLKKNYPDTKYKKETADFFSTDNNNLLSVGTESMKNNFNAPILFSNTTNGNAFGVSNDYNSRNNDYNSRSNQRNSGGRNPRDRNRLNRKSVQDNSSNQVTNTNSTVNQTITEDWN